MAALLTREIDIESWLIFSTIVSVFLFVRVLHAGIDIFAGYPIVVLNTLLLALLGRLVIHRWQAVVIAIVAGWSMAAAHFSATPITSVLAQILGITLMSVCYFSALVTSGLTVPRWMDLYASAAFYLAVLGIGLFVAQHTIMYAPGGDPRLKSIYTEPSIFVYTTLPAAGYYINTWFTERRCGLETLIFLFSYILADSVLGFLGLLLICAFTFLKRLNVWHLLVAFVFGGALLAALFFSSENFRLRATDTVMALSNQSLASTNASTFALLSNFYVAGSAVVDHPILGVGIGGYRSAYELYIHNLGEENLQGNNDSLGLNKDDANSLFVRVTAELGPLGLIVLLGFLIVCAKVDGSPYRQIRNALLPYFLVRMSRFGAYFSMELYFFVGIYLLNYMEYRRAVTADKPAPLPSPAALRLA